MVPLIVSPLWNTEFISAHKLGAALIGLYVLDVNLIQGPMLTDISGSVGMPPYDGFF